MTKKFEWDFFSKVPEHTRGALERYFLYAFEPGSFVKAVLCNDLYSSVARADTWNKQALADIVSWIAKNAPEGSWGHEDYYKEWINKGPAYEKFQKSLVWETLNADHTEIKEQDW
jgi:hypothetical protein